MTPATLRHRLARLEHHVENTASLGELRAYIARLSAIALIHMEPANAEYFLNALLGRANQEAQLAFLDQVRDALATLEA